MTVRGESTRRTDPDGLQERVRDGPPVLLDGPMGTELHRRGFDTVLPLWSAQANQVDPDLVMAIHRDYALAGAELHTANTFRTNPRTLEKAGLSADEAGQLVSNAIGSAARALQDVGDRGSKGWILGSLAPVEDCYRPADVPDDDALRREHQVHAELMAHAGVDGFLVETMNTVREARRAAEAAAATGLPFLVSFVAGPDGCVLSGEPIHEGAEAVQPVGPEAILVNCSNLGVTTKACESLASSGAARWGAYANVGTADPVMGWEQGRDVSIDEYVGAAKAWRNKGASIIGSCCGTTPEFTKALRQTFNEDE